MPAILQKPPNGSALMPYSVSPRRKDQRVVPKPRKKRSTFIPKSFAVAKWPPSWNKMASMRAKTNSRTPSRLLMRSPWCGMVLDQCTGQAARPLLGAEDRLEVQLGGLLVGGEDLGDDLGDAGEGQAAGEERGDRLLVRRVEHGGRGATCPPGPDGEVEEREGGPVGRLELERHGPRPVDAPDRLGRALGP